MDPVLQKDAKALMADARMIKEGIKRLEDDYMKWTTKREKIELSDLIESVKGIEVDVHLMMADSISLGCQEEKATDDLFNDYHQFFVCLDDLFFDLKKARSELKDAYIGRSTFSHLEADCGRFLKNVLDVQEHLR